MKERLQDNLEKIKLNKQLPYLVSNIVEILEVDPEGDADEEGANVDLDDVRKGKCAVVKTSTRTVLRGRQRDSSVASNAHRCPCVDGIFAACRSCGCRHPETGRPGRCQ